MDGSIMYDGGIYDNFPVKHMKSQFNPDVLIGSKAAMGNTAPDEFDILGQIENIVMKPASYAIDSGQGILLDHDLKKQSLLAFEKLDEFVEIGYQTTLEKMDSIKMLVHRQAEDSASLNKKRELFVSSFPELRFSQVEIEGLNEMQQSYVKRSIRRSDRILDIKEMKTEYLKLAGDQSFAYLHPEAMYNPLDSLFTMKLRVIPQTPLEVRFGLFFATTGMAQTYLGVSYRQISEINTHLKGSLQFGRFYNGANVGVRFDYPSRIPVFMLLNFNYNGYNYNTFSSNFFFEDLNAPYITEDEINFRFDVGIPYKINGIIKGGVGIGRNREVYYMTENFSSTDTSEISNVNLLSAYLASVRNTLNDKQFPTEGTRRTHSLRVGYGQENYIPGSANEIQQNERMNYTWFSARFENTGYIPLGGSFSLGYHIQAELTFKPLLSNYFSTMIEATAFQPNLVTKGLFMQHYRANQFIALGLMPVYSFKKQIHAKLEAYAFFPVQEILVDQDNEAYLGGYFKTMKPMINATLNLVTVAGPISLNLGYIAEEQNPWLIQLSFGYLLFNKKSADE
jgi:NTE family protein